MNDTPWSELGMTLEERKGEYACEPSDNQEKNCPWTFYWCNVSPFKGLGNSNKRVAVLWSVKGNVILGCRLKGHIIFGVKLL